MDRTVYAGFDSPVGTIFIRRSAKGISDLTIGMDEDGFIEKMRHKYGDGPLHDEKAFHAVFKQLEDYFSGEKTVFDAPLDLFGSAFDLRVWKAIGSIPWGRTKTYSEIAGVAGSLKGARAAGGACGRNQVPIIIPCHRVLASNGKLGGYTGGAWIKKALLGIEGIELPD